MKKFSFVNVGAWNRTFSSQYLHFSSEEKKKILGKFRSVNATDAMEAQCLYLRQVLDMLVNFLLRQEAAEIDISTLHLNEKIELVSQHLAGFKSISHEFHVIRGITNGYIHGQGRNLKADRKTLILVLNKIQKWFITYAQYVKCQEERKRWRVRYETGSHKTFFIVICVLVLAGLGCLAWLKLM